MVQAQSQAKSSGIKLPDIHGISKGLDLKIQPEKQVIKPMISKGKEIPQIKPRFRQGRAGLRCKKPQITHPIAQSVKQPVKIPAIPKTQNIVTTIPSFATPVQLRDDSHSKVKDRQMIQNANRDILPSQIQSIDSLLNQLKNLYPKSQDIWTLTLNSI